jgi:cytochrome oxidase assembly protein ShyY1
MSDPVSASGRQWRLDWRLLLFSGLFLPVLLSLGFWQLDRADEKKVRLAQWEIQSNQLDWPEHLQAGLTVGQPVDLRGRYQDKTWLLDNRTRNGAPGYEVLTLFQPEQGKPLVINRGWVKAPRRRDELPDIQIPTGSVDLSGRLSEYPVPPVLMDTAVDQSQWPRRVQVLTRQDARNVSKTVASLILRLDDTSQPGAYRADWAPDRMGVQTHYGYAVQWFSLATALIVLTVVASYRKTERKDDNG